MRFIVHAATTRERNGSIGLCLTRINSGAAEKFFLRHI